jgi:hypothetical protein
LSKCGGSRFRLHSLSYGGQVANPSFCNGLRLVNPFLRSPFAGTRFCPRSVQDRHLTGTERMDGFRASLAIALSVYKNVLFCVYDLGEMRDVSRRPSKKTDVRMCVIKH